MEPADIRSEAEIQRAALAAAVETIGERWTLLLIAALLEAPRRFGELQEQVEGIAPNILTDRLRRLERAGIVVARPYSERPPRYVYELTSRGGELSDALRLLAGWGSRNARPEDRPVHGLCGTALEARWWCPACEQVIGGDEEELHLA